MSLVSVVLIVFGLGVAFLLALLRALALDEVRGRIQRRVETSVEATISSLPPELQEEWADEWRGELAAMKSMPLSAITFARGLRQTALQLTGASELAPARAGSSNKVGWLRGDRFGRVASSLSNSRILTSMKKWWELIATLFLGAILLGVQALFSTGAVITVALLLTLVGVALRVWLRER